MKKSTLTKILKFLNIEDYHLIVFENGFKMDFTNDESKNSEKIYQKPDQLKNSISSLLILIMLFLFTNFLFAQQPPACNLKGPLKASYSNGQLITINSEVVNDLPTTKYVWTLKNNTSNASFISKNGGGFMTINPGNKGGKFTLQLDVINPTTSTVGPKTKSCSCTQSVTVIQ